MEKTKTIRVAFADNEKQTREKMSACLEHSHGIELLACTDNGKELAHAVCEGKPDVVVMNLFMPDLDGIGVIKEIEKHAGEGYRPAYLIMSPVADEAILKNVYDQGADYFIIKPFREKDLVERIRWTYSFKKRKAENSSGIVTTIGAKNRGTKRTLRMTSREKNNIVDSTQIVPGALGQKIGTMLMEMGVKPKCIGHEYLKYAICLGLEDQRRVQHIGKEIYPQIAQHFQTTVYAVERSIRYSIERAWSVGNIERLNEVFGDVVSKEKGKTTNEEFVANFVLYMKNERLQFQMAK